MWLNSNKRFAIGQRRFDIDQKLLDLRLTKVLSSTNYEQNCTIIDKTAKIKENNSFCLTPPRSRRVFCGQVIAAEWL